MFFQFFQPRSNKKISFSRFSSPYLKKCHFSSFSSFPSFSSPLATLENISYFSSCCINCTAMVCIYFTQISDYSICMYHFPKTFHQNHKYHYWTELAFNNKMIYYTFLICVMIFIFSD